MDPIELLAHLSMGLALAGAAGLRAFFPLAAISLMARADMLTLAQSWDFLASDGALVVLLSATILELLGDKVPVVDHVLDTAGTLVKPLAGGVASASIVTGVDPLLGMTLALIGGATLAGGVHTLKASLRGLSTLTTAGLGNPLISFAEDGAAAGAVGMAIFVPIAALLCLVVALGGVFIWFRRRGAREAQAA